MKNFFNVALLLLIPLFWNFGFIHWCLNTRGEPPLVEAVIPESTLAFLDSLANRFLGGDDHLVLTQVDSISTDSWNNKHDFGYKDSNGFYVYEVDSLFVIYSDVSDFDLAEKTRQYAHNAIEPMKRLMGHYVYPYMVNGRKLSLYLCTNEDVYQNACRALTDGDGDYSKTWGLCVYRYSGYEVQTLGITLNYGSMRRISSNPDLDLNATVWHEMNHYVYFQSIDLSQEISMHTWMYEGLAEHFASQIKKQTTELTNVEKEAVYNNNLSSTFDPFSFNYSGGELFYDYLESRYGELTVNRFIQDIYSSTLDEALYNMGSGTRPAQEGWVRYIENNYI